MSYIVIELQTTNGTTANIVSQYSDKNLAEQKYHQILASAAVSTVDIHTALMTDEYGHFLRAEHYEHNTEEEE